MRIRLCNVIILNNSKKVKRLPVSVNKFNFHYNILFYWADKEMNIKAIFLIIVQSYTI